MPYLNYPHRESSLLGQLLSNVPGRLRCLGECSLQDFQLFGLDRRPRSASLSARPVVGTLVLAVLPLAAVVVPIDGVVVVALPATVYVLITH